MNKDFSGIKRKPSSAVVREWSSAVESDRVDDLFSDVVNSGFDPDDDGEKQLAGE